MCVKDGEIYEKLEISDFELRNSFWDGSHLTELLLLQFSVRAVLAAPFLHKRHNLGFPFTHFIVIFSVMVIFSPLEEVKGKGQIFL